MFPGQGFFIMKTDWLAAGFNIYAGPPNLLLLNPPGRFGTGSGTDTTKCSDPLDPDPPQWQTLTDFHN